jgi:hypothetical protein
MLTYLSSENKLLHHTVPIAELSTPWLLSWNSPLVHLCVESQDMRTILSTAERNLSTFATATGQRSPYHKKYMLITHGKFKRCQLKMNAPRNAPMKMQMMI